MSKTVSEHSLIEMDIGKTALILSRRAATAEACAPRAPAPQERLLQ